MTTRLCCHATATSDIDTDHLSPSRTVICEGLEIYLRRSGRLQTELFTTGLVQLCTCKVWRFITAVSPKMPFFKSHHRRAIHNSGPPQDSSLFTEKPRDLPSKAVLRCMGGDISAVVPVQVAALDPHPAYVYAGSRTVPRMTPAFQSGHSAELQRRCFLSSGRLRLPPSTFGGFATLVPPLAAVAARGAVVNINVSDAVPNMI